MIQTYKDLKDYKFEDNGQIPKIIFRTGSYKLNDLPSQIAELYKKEMFENTDYTLFYFDDKDCEDFIILEYGVIMFDYYSKLIPTAFKADFWRYLILQKYGGIYIDFTMHTIIPYNEIIKPHRRQIYVRDSCDICGIYNAFIASIPNTQLLQKAIDKVIENIKNKNRGVSALDVTGPAMLGRLFKQELNLLFYDWIPIGGIRNDLYLYSNPSNEFIQDEFGTKIIKNRLENHYELAYNEKLHPLVQDMKPLNHYSRLWSDDKVFR